MGEGLQFLVLPRAILFALSLLLISIVALAEGPGDYQLGTGDNIRIHVFQEADLTVEARISDTGTISYPLLGEIRVAGLTISQLEKKIFSGLKDGYLVNPQVSISVAEYRQFFINGEVKQPGAYAYAPGLTVRKAVSFAGGFAERAAKDNIFILHEGSANSKPERARIDDKVLPGDIITVEQSFF